MTQSGEEAQVRCYSGHVYPERPVAFLWEGIERQVAEIEQASREPGVRVFIVRDNDGNKFRISYQESGDRWIIVPVTPESPS